MAQTESGNAVDATLNLIERVRRECLDHPATLAIEAGPYRVTYGELAHQADSIAAMVRRSAGAPGAVVAVLVADRAALVAVMLGVFQAGCVFVPLNSYAPAEQLDRLVIWLQPKLLLTVNSNDALVKRLATSLGDATSILTVPHAVEKVPDGESSLIRAPSPTEIVAAPAHAPSYVYFTSGTSGQPKGIAGTLQSLAKRIAWEINAFQIPRGFRVSQLITPTFDPWFRDIFVPLCVGGTICIPPDRPAHLMPETLLEWLRDSKINLMHWGPTLLNMLVSAPPRIRRLPDLRLTLVSGEFLHVSLASRWRRRFGTEPRLVNIYGTTEATMMQFHHVIGPADLKRDFIPIGRPLPDVDILLTDEHGKRCASGQMGEILIGGPTLSLGYFRDDEATRKAFVEVDMPDGNRKLFYQTGDLGVEFEDGTYRLLGRRDDQVKIRGVRVETREVEDALTGYPLVAACAVTVHRGGDGEPSLVAYVVPETEHPPAVPEMRAYLRERLPLEMIPAKFVMIKELPLTDTGKVDRRMLLELAPANEVSANAVAPRNLLETVLAKYWCEILGLSQVGVHDHFMDLGGHSLNAMRLLVRLRENLGLKLSVRDILDNSTIAKLANRIAALEISGSGKELIVTSTVTAHLSFPAPGSSDLLGAASNQPPPTSSAEFACPTAPSPFFGARHCNLVMFLGNDADRDTFEKVAHLVEEFDSTIHTEIVEDKPGWLVQLKSRPTLFFSPALIRNRPRVPGRIFCGYPLSKSEEYTILSNAAISVPPWVTLREGELPNLDGFGNYVVRKPDYGAKGAEVRIVKRGRVRWKRVVTAAAGPSPTLLVQEFIYTGLWPVSYRVNTLFGRVLYCLRLTGNTNRPTLRGPNDFDSRGSLGNSVSIVANVRDSKAEYCDDVEIIRFGERAASAFPDLPLLGVDVLKEAGTGRLFATEVNALGHNWNFSREFSDSFGVDVAAQFDGMRKAAYVLAEQTQRLANLDQNT